MSSQKVAPPPLAVVIRPPDAGEMSAVIGAWVDSHVHGLRLENQRIKAWAQAAQKALTKACLERSRVLVASPEELPSIVAGYVVYEPTLLHWVYVKHAYRGAGVGTALIRAAFGDVRPIPCSHWTQAATYRRQGWGLVYAPERLPR